MAKLASFRAILAIATHYDWDIESFDFNGAYLNGGLDDNEIYMQSPLGYQEDTGTIRKSLYGLKQARHKWYDTLSRALANLGFVLVKQTQEFSWPVWARTRSDTTLASTTTAT